ncbi:MAG: NAD(P)-dependent oxidoreductase, partial [Thermoanaerobaculia bacterium]
RDAFRGNELAGKVLGIVGMGRVGSQVAEFGRAFRMSVVAFDPLLDDWAPDVGRARSIEDLVRRAEVVSIHLLLDDATKGLFGRGVISAMRRGSWLVNTSRGEIVNELALAESLARGHLAGAAVDVLADEHDGERRGSSPLLDYARQHDNLIITPHVAGATVESMRRTEEFMAQQVLELHGRASGPREGSR